MIPEKGSIRGVEGATGHGRNTFLVVFWSLRSNPKNESALIFRNIVKRVPLQKYYFCNLTL
jgi:hypothetical protein